MGGGGIQARNILTRSVTEGLIKTQKLNDTLWHGHTSVITASYYSCFYLRKKKSFYATPLEILPPGGFYHALRKHTRIFPKKKKFLGGVRHRVPNF